MESAMTKYSKKAQEKVEEAVSAHKHKGKYQNKKQAVAVGLSKARKTGAKAPKKK